jgi:hypothetical protein
MPKSKEVTITTAALKYYQKCDAVVGAVSDLINGLGGVNGTDLTVLAAGLKKLQKAYEAVPEIKEEDMPQ